HCHVPPDASVEDAHDAVSALEQKIRGQIDGVRRIIVHAEPPALPLATEPA
ncbi:cation transporter dimerization domain-containing protein, partial [Aliidongia sp.]